MALGQVLQRSAFRCLDVVLPPRCLGCGSVVEGSDRLCADCWRGLTFLGPPLCRLCGYPLPEAAAELPVCGVCSIEPPPFDRARAALRYDDGARGMILRFKHADRIDIASTFGRMLANAGAELLPDCDVIAPVPLHRWRLLKRGYNQAALLTRTLSDLSGRPTVPDLLQRTRATASQQGLGSAKRRQNVNMNAFRPHPWHRRRIAGRRVLLIDDVLTTGATIEACTRVLKRAGASAVDVLALARVVRDEGSTICKMDPPADEAAARSSNSAPSSTRERQHLPNA